jgi:hypothetical protein
MYQELGQIPLVVYLVAVMMDLNVIAVVSGVNIAQIILAMPL